MNTIEEALDRLAELRAAQDAARIQWEQLRDEIMAPLRDKLNALDMEFGEKVRAAADNADELEMQIREQVLNAGHSVKGTRMTAVWSKGRVSWDTKKLDGLMIALPQLAACRSEGAPSVSIRVAR